MNRLDLGEALVCVVDSGSFVAASKRLRITTAAVSKKISKLEKHLSIRLLDRGRKGVQLTQAGQIYYHQIKQLLGEFNLFENAFLHAEQEVKGTIRIVGNRFYFSTFVLPKLSQFLERYPKVELEFNCAEVIPDFQERRADVILGVSLPSIQENVKRIKIDSTRYVLCGSQRYFDQLEEPRSPTELLKHTFLIHGSRPLQDRIYLDEDQEIRIKKRITINDTDLLIKAALLGLGMIWTHENLVRKFIEKKQLVTVLDEYLKTPHSVYLYYPIKKMQSRAIQAFTEFFRTV